MSKTIGLVANDKKTNPISSEEVGKSLQKEMDKLQKKKKYVPEGNKVLEKEKDVQKKETSQMSKNTGVQSDYKE